MCHASTQAPLCLAPLESVLAPAMPGSTRMVRLVLGAFLARYAIPMLQPLVAAMLVAFMIAVHALATQGTLVMVESAVLAATNAPRVSTRVEISVYHVSTPVHPLLARQISVLAPAMKVSTKLLLEFLRVSSVQCVIRTRLQVDTVRLEVPKTK